ncbi:hypothetical protein MRB53_022113 [Persea americana]|uniref:Uncharacterized protein n=1 Tax=Persea americana TaxID=3435 RepID=A0ACC2L6F0_PERAE|nr:hypothetical protein MRB53_022113 [Persea americana]
MKMVVIRNLNAPKNFPFYNSSFFYSSLFPAHAVSFPFRSNPSPFSPNNCLLVHAKKRNSQLEPLLKRTTTDQEDKEEVDEFQKGTNSLGMLRNWALALSSVHFDHVSSPGVERIVQIPQELDRFKDKPLYVKYVNEKAATESPKESDGVFKLVSFDSESSYCTWSIADVRKNREQAGKGRPLSKKQREWRLQTPFDSLRLVQLYSDCWYMPWHVLNVLGFLR